MIVGDGPAMRGYNCNEQFLPLSTDCRETNLEVQEETEPGAKKDPGLKMEISEINAGSKTSSVKDQSGTEVQDVILCKARQRVVVCSSLVGRPTRCSLLFLFGFLF